MRDNQTDLELIDKVLAGNTAAFSELVNRHQRYVFTLALRFTKSREDAEEIAQDCFVKAVWNSLSYLHDFFKKEAIGHRVY